MTLCGHIPHLLQLFIRPRHSLACRRFVEGHICTINTLAKCKAFRFIKIRLDSGKGFIRCMHSAGNVSATYPRPIVMSPGIPFKDGLDCLNFVEVDAIFTFDSNRVQKSCVK